jgi:hypothetical protein
MKPYVYRSWSTPAPAPRSTHRIIVQNGWGKITQAGVRRRAELLYQELDGPQALLQAARHDLLAKSPNDVATKLLCQIPISVHSGGSVDSADPDAAPVSHQETTVGVKRFGIGDTQQGSYLQGQLQRWNKPVALRGLNANHKHDLKAIFKGAAVKASTIGALREFYTVLLTKG